MNDFYLNVKLLSKNAKMPTRGTVQSAGLDFYTPKDFIIFPREAILIPLDISIEMPEGYAIIMKEKSGVSTRTRTDLGACVIDSDYRGNCHVHLFNNSDEEVIFNKGDKVCQGLIVPVWIGQPKEVEELNMNTERGEGGFGSTDNKI
jgi:dUTP pyrophosphatase